MVIFIEPLLSKIKTLVKEGQKDCLKKSMTLFGSESDIKTLSESIRKQHEIDKNRLLLVDFTPLLSLGTHTRLHSLEKLYNEIPFIVVAKQGIVFEQLKSLRNISTIVCNKNTEIINFLFIGKWNKKFKKVVPKELKQGQNVLETHGDWVENTLLEIIPDSIRKPPTGTRYLPLHDGAWANLWIDVKSIVKEPEIAFFIAYQIGYLLTRGYSENLREEGFVVGNNTAYILASFLHQIFDKKELVMIDRLGPYPNLSKTRLIGLERIEGKKLCMVEDVMSTGRELDMTQLIVYLHKAEIVRAVCLFNLEIALSRLIPEDKILFLCKPSNKIGYKRFPKYAKQEKVK